MQIPTAIDETIKGEEVLLLQSIYAEERTSTFARAVSRQFAMAYGKSIQSKALRHAVIAYAAALLPPTQFQETSERHASQATSLLMLKLDTPSTLAETDVFTACMLMWLLWNRNRRDLNIVHAKGVIAMLEHLWAKEEGYSDLFGLFGPLAYSDAYFYVLMGDPSDIETLFPSHGRRTTFNQRVAFHGEIISRGGSAIVWCSAKVQALADDLRDTEHLLFELLLELIRGGKGGSDESDTRMRYLSLNYKDPDLQQAIASLSWPQSHPMTFEEEVTTYLAHQLLSIKLLMLLVRAPTILQGLRSPDVVKIAKEQLSRGRSHSLPLEGDAFQCYTWAFVMNLGLVGLIFCPEKLKEGTSAVKT